MHHFLYPRLIEVLRDDRIRCHRERPARPFRGDGDVIIPPEFGEWTEH